MKAKKISPKAGTSRAYIAVTLLIVLSISNKTPLSKALFSVYFIGIYQ